MYYPLLDAVKVGKVISYSYPKGTVIETGTLIDVVISKGQVKMIEFTDLTSFRKWAEEYEVNFYLTPEILNSYASLEPNLYGMPFPRIPYITLSENIHIFLDINIFISVLIPSAFYFFICIIVMFIDNI